MTSRKPGSKSPLHYLRDKNKVQIKGDAEDVRSAMWMDLISSKILWLMAGGLMGYLTTKAIFISLLLHWLKKHF